MSGQQDGDSEDLYVENTLAHADRQILEVEGVSFTWWSVNTNPAFVTVSNLLYGHCVDLTHGDPEERARQLAVNLLREHRARTRRR